MFKSFMLNFKIYSKEKLCKIKNSIFTDVVNIEKMK